MQLSPELIALLSVVATQAIKWGWGKIGGNLPFWLKPILSAIMGAILKSLGVEDGGITVEPTLDNIGEGAVAGFGGSKIYDFGSAAIRGDTTALRSKHQYL